MSDAFLPRTGLDGLAPQGRSRVWTVSALLRAITDSLEARLDPVMVKGELYGLSRTASGH